MYNSVPVQVDRQWLEEVRNICGEEDMDRIMAQTIALEDNQQATSRDHLYGIEDRVLREGQYANTVRGNVQCIGMYMYIQYTQFCLYMSHPRQLIFLRKSDCLVCAVLLCLVVCLTLLLSSFLLISH